jgi:hypothetical protein
MQSWTDALPLVMLGIQTSIKEDLHLTAADMVYGTTLCVPGEFFTPSPIQQLPDLTNYVSHHKTLMQQLRPSQPRLPSRKTYVSSELSDCTHVFIRQDAIRKPLDQPYDGAYPVLNSKDTYFITGINGRRDTVSLDRLKPAYLDQPVQSPTLSTKTKLTLYTTTATYTVTTSTQNPQWSSCAVLFNYVP